MSNLARAAVVVTLLLALACGRSPANERERLAVEFERTLTGATLVGRFSSLRSDRIGGDRYTIAKVTRLPAGIWLIHTRIQYGGNDYTAPVPVRVEWAGDTPVITLTDVGIPGRGTFTARVLFYREQYAGTWSSSEGHGGQMWGRIERGEAAR